MAVTAKTQIPEWAGLVYSVPASPSKARVYIWRKLRVLGAQNIRPGFAILPNTKENISSFEVLAQRVREFKGDAVIAELNFASQDDTNKMRNLFNAGFDAQLYRLFDECIEISNKIAALPQGPQRSLLEQQLVKKMLKAQQKKEKSYASNAISQQAQELVDTLRSMPTEFSSMLRDKK